MLIAGAGVGPIFAVFTIIVQNPVPFHELGAATSDLTLFRQIGTTLGLTLAFTLFRNNLTWGLLHDQIVAAGAPASSVPTTPPPGFDLGALTSVGSAGANPLAFVQSPAGGNAADLHHRLPRRVHDRDRELHVPRCRGSRRGSGRGAVRPRDPASRPSAGDAARATTQEPSAAI